jgi:hypothetical protein
MESGGYPAQLSQVATLQWRHVMFAPPVAKKKTAAPQQANTWRAGADASANRKPEREVTPEAKRAWDIGSIPVFSPGDSDRPKADLKATHRPAAIRDVLGSGGAPLEATARADMEWHFGRSLGDVRVHTGVRAVESAREVHARAYTLGNDIVFGEREYAPATPAGRTLLAHELAHTVQQRGASRSAHTAGPHASLERSADAAALRVVSGLPVGALPVADLQIARKPVKEESEAEKLARHRFSKSPKKKSVAPAGPGNQKKAPAADPAKERAAAVAEAEAVARRHQSDKDDASSKPAPPQPASAQKYPYQDLAEGSGDAGKSPAPAQQDPAIRRAQEKFRKRHKDHSPGNLYNIDRALERVTRNNPDLLIAYYEYYSDHKLTDELDNKKRAGETSSGDTDLNEDVLALSSTFSTSDPISLLGGTLLHEYSHTPQGGKKDPVNQAPDEAKAYGIELFFAERMGDKKRADFISKRSSNDSVDVSTGSDKIFTASYDTISRLYEVIDKGGPQANEARQMSVEFISKNAEDYGPKLRAFIARR